MRISKSRVANEEDVLSSIRARRDFTTPGRLWAASTSDGAAHYGELPVSWAPAVEVASYIIYSGDTPIAWAYSDGRFIVPNITYKSVTIRKHQQLVEQMR